MKEVDIVSLKKLVSPIGKIKNIYHANNVNMQLSFDSLKKMIEEQQGVVLTTGDIFVCDSVNGKSRKALIRVSDGWLILYYRLDKTKDISVQRVRQ